MAFDAKQKGAFFWKKFLIEMLRSRACFVVKT